MMPDRLLVIGGSAGSLQVILSVLAGIGDDFSMPVLVCLHRNGVFESSLEDLFSTRTNLPIKEVEEKEPLREATIYICPADYHVLLEKDHSFSLDYSERVHFSRPSIDVTFRSAADTFGPGLICLLLSGNGGCTIHAATGYFTDACRFYRAGEGDSRFYTRAEPQAAAIDQSRRPF